MTTALYHKAGIKIEGEARECISHALKFAGLTYGIRREHLTTLPRDGVPSSVIPNRVALFRDDTNAYLATVGSDYYVSSNRDTFLPLDILTSTGKYEVDLVGEFGGGRKAFVVLKSLAEGGESPIEGGDVVGNYLLFSTAHDGQGSLRGAVLPYRFSCSNAIAGAMRKRGFVSLRHTPNLKFKSEELLRFIRSVPEQFRGQCELFRALVRSRPTLDGAEEFLLRLKVSPKISEYILGTEEAREVNLRSYWALYNAYNGYLNHESSPRPESRLRSVLFGENAKRDQLALEVALQLAT